MKDSDAGIEPDLGKGNRHLRGGEAV